MSGIGRRVATGLQDALAPAGKRYVPLDPMVDLTGNRVLVDDGADQAAVEAARHAFRRTRFHEREHWLTGRIPSNASRQGALPYVFIGLGLLLIAAGLGAALAWGGGFRLLALFLTVVGGGFAGLSTRILLQQRKYPPGELRLASTPLVLGESFHAEVSTGVSRTTPPAAGFQLVLRALHRRHTGSGSSASTSERTVWEHAESAPGTPQPGADTLTIAIELKLPGDAPTTTLGPGPERYLWRLSVRAEMPGIDYQEAFDLPVFRREDAAHLTRQARHPPTHERLPHRAVSTGASRRRRSTSASSDA